MIYKLMKRMIERKNYDTVEEMKEKIAVFNLQGSLTDAERDELYEMLNEQEGE